MLLVARVQRVLVTLAETLVTLYSALRYQMTLLLQLSSIQARIRPSEIVKISDKYR
jgi:hypothetical protein